MKSRKNCFQRLQHRLKGLGEDTWYFKFLWWIRFKYMIFVLGEKFSCPWFLCSKDFPQKINGGGGKVQMLSGSKLSILYVFTADFQETHLTYKVLLSLWREGQSIRRWRKCAMLLSSSYLPIQGHFLKLTQPLLMTGIQSWSDLASVAWQFYSFQWKVISLSLFCSNFLILCLSLRLHIPHLFSLGKVTMGDWL